MKRHYKLTANAVWALHVVWILIIVGGIPVMALKPAYGFVEFGLILATLTAQKVWRGCPLTLLEEGLREKHDPTYKRRASFLEPIFKRIGLQAHPIRPVHLGFFALIVFVLTNVARR